MSGTSIGSLSAIVVAGKYLDNNIDFKSPASMRSTMEDMLRDKDCCDSMWKALRGLGPASNELSQAEVGLGGKEHK